MKVNTILLAIALGTSLASGQTPTEPNQDCVFDFAHTETVQQVQEIATLIQRIADIPQLSVDETQRAINVHGTSDQVALARWLFNELDQPVNQQPPRSQGGTTLEYRMPGSGDNVVRVFYLPYAKTMQEFHEAVTVVRSIADIRRMFTYSAPGAVAARGTAEQTALAEWLFNELGKTTNQDSTAPEYRMPSGDDVVRVLHLPHTKTVQDFQEVATLVRSIADIRRLFIYSAPRAFALRGTSEQVALAEWLVSELDKSTTNNWASNEYRMSDGNENVVRVFYLPHAATVQDFQQIAVFVRTSTNIRRALTYTAPRALVLRGTDAQIAQAAQLIAERTKPD